jgi:hypothetical protein
MRLSAVLLAAVSALFVRTEASQVCQPCFQIQLSSPLDRYVVTEGLCIGGPGRYFFPGAVTIVPTLNETTVVSRATILCIDCQGLIPGALPNGICTLGYDGVTASLQPQFSVTPDQPSPVPNVLVTIPGPGPLWLIGGCLARSIIFSLPPENYCSLVGRAYHFQITFYDAHGCPTNTVEKIWVPDSSCKGQCQTQCPFTDGVNHSSI